MPDESAVALILLAAGASTRMGRPKQLLPIGGQPLLRAVAEAALAAPVAPVVVVLGAHANTVSSCLDGLAVHRAFNPHWATGMASSIRCGIAAVEQIAPDSPAVIMALADQPGLSATHLANLLATRQRTRRTIVATEHDGVLQPPACFDRTHFAVLQQLTGDAGARHLFKHHAQEVATVPLATHPDLDTPADYERLRAAPRGD